MRLPAAYNLVILRGVVFDVRFQLLGSDGAAVDMTGWQASAHVRAAHSTQSELILDLTPSIEEDGYVNIYKTAEETAALTAVKGCWDLRLTDAAGLSGIYVQGYVMIHDIVTPE